MADPALVANLSLVFVSTKCTPRITRYIFTAHCKCTPVVSRLARSRQVRLVAPTFYTNSFFCSIPTLTIATILGFFWPSTFLILTICYGMNSSTIQGITFGAIGIMLAGASVFLAYLQYERMRIIRGNTPDIELNSHNA